MALHQGMSLAQTGPAPCVLDGGFHSYSQPLLGYPYTFTLTRSPLHVHPYTFTLTRLTEQLKRLRVAG
jgi:hypothetical protein